MKRSVGLWKSTTKTNIKHNNREQDEYENKLIDVSREKENKYLIQEDIKKIYEREFGEALEKYNAKQKRKDRKIKDYYKHIQKGKKTSPQQEMIIQVGEGKDYEFGDDGWRIANEILEEYVKEFEKRNPNLKVYNAVIHNDETTPHLHLNFVPVATGYKRGLEKQVAFDRAIKQQDEQFNVDRPFDVWRDSEVEYISELMREYGIERKLVGTNEIEDTNELKRITAEREKLARERELLEKEKKAYFENLNKNIDSAANERLTYSYKEKAIEEYETVEKNFFGKEKVVVKKREIETENYVMTPKQIQKVNKAFNHYKYLKSEYKRLEGVLSEEIGLRKEQEQKHQKQLETLKKEINERAERLKDEQFYKLEKENAELKDDMKHLNINFKQATTDVEQIYREKEEVKGVLKQAVADNERLYEENNKLRESVDYFKWRFSRLWSVTKEYLRDYVRDAKHGIETIGDWFAVDTGEEIEPKPQKKKNKEYDHDLEL
jgi:hypothetical protein